MISILDNETYDKGIIKRVDQEERRRQTKNVQKIIREFSLVNNVFDEDILSLVRDISSIELDGEIEDSEWFKVVEFCYRMKNFLKLRKVWIEENLKGFFDIYNRYNS